MRRYVFGVLLGAALLSLTACDLEEMVGHGGSQRFSSDFHYSYPLQAGGRLSVDNYNGAVEISGWDQDTVDISGSRYGQSQELRDQVKIDIDHTPSAVSIRTVRPSAHGNTGARYAIKVPRKVELDRIVSTNGSLNLLDLEGPARLKTSNASIRVSKFRGAIDAQTSNATIDLEDVEGSAILHTTNGRIHAENVRGPVEGATSNASIRIALAKLEPGRSIRLETSNGSIDLTLPPNAANDVRASTSNAGITVHMPPSANAHVTARTSNANVSSDFEMKTQGVSDRRHIDATIGNGGPLLDLSTSNGSIRLLKM